MRRRNGQSACTDYSARFACYSPLRQWEIVWRESRCLRRFCGWWSSSLFATIAGDDTANDVRRGLDTEKAGGSEQVPAGVQEDFLFESEGEVFQDKLRRRIRRHGRDA